MEKVNAIPIPVPVESFKFDVVAAQVAPRCVIENLKVEPQRVETGNTLAVKFMICNKGDGVLQPRMSLAIKGPSPIPVRTTVSRVVPAGKCNAETIKVVIPKVARAGTYVGTLTCYGGQIPVTKRIEVKAI